jgi:hypothetical protein
MILVRLFEFEVPKRMRRDMNFNFAALEECREVEDPEECEKKGKHHGTACAQPIVAHQVSRSSCLCHSSRLRRHTLRRDHSSGNWMILFTLSA